MNNELLSIRNEIIYDCDFEDIKLVPFYLMRNDKNLRSLYLNWLNDSDIVRPIASPSLMGPKGPEFIEQSFARFTQPHSQGYFIWYMPESIFIGTTKLDSISLDSQSASSGIMIGDKTYHGRGLAIAIYKILLGYAFINCGLNRISDGCNENNIPAYKTYRRLGFKLEGTFRQADYIEGKFSDHLHFGILREEFLAINKVKVGIIKNDIGFITLNN